MPIEQLKRLKALLAMYEDDKKSFKEHELAAKIEALIKEISECGEEVEFQLQAEYMAFMFHADYQSQEGGWGTYYGPMGVFSDGKGSYFEVPSIRNVTEEALNYWEMRSSESKNSLLKSRYSDLVWDFSKNIRGKIANIKVAEILIESTIDCSINFTHDLAIENIKKLRRALSVVLQIGNEKLREKVIGEIVRYDEQLSKNLNDGNIGFSYDILIDQKVVEKNSEQENRIIAIVENILEDLRNCDEKESDPFTLELTAIRLAKYYNRNNKPDDVKRVLKQYADRFLSLSKKVDPIIGSSWLKKVYETYHMYGLRSETEQIEKAMRELEKEVPKSMGTISTDITIPKEEIVEFIDNIKKGTKEEICNNIAYNFIPNKTEAEKTLKEIARENLLYAMLPRIISDHKGRPIASVGSADKDLEGRIILQISQSMHFNGIYLDKVMEKLEEEQILSVDVLFEHIVKSPIIDDYQQPILRLGLERYADGDYISFSSVVIPQIEAAIRNLFELVGGNIYRIGRNGELRLRVLDDMLRDELIVKAFNENVAYYFRVFLTDQRGWNLRNDICHGMYKYENITKKVANRIIHVLLVLALLKRTKSEN